MVQKFKCEFKISLAPFITISFYSYLVQTFLCHHMYLFNHIISTLVLSCPEVLRLLPGGRKKNDNQSSYDRLFLILRSLNLVLIRFHHRKKINTVNSRFKKVHSSFFKSRVVWFKKDLCSESKNQSHRGIPAIRKVQKISSRFKCSWSYYNWGC